MFQTWKYKLNMMMLGQENCSTYPFESWWLVFDIFLDQDKCVCGLTTNLINCWCQHHKDYNNDVP